MSLERFELHDRIALVTGSSRGIGAAIARSIVDAGGRVAITYNSNEAAAKAVADDIGAALVLQLDVTSRDSVQAGIERVVDELGGLDIVVNNAGILEQKDFSTITEQDWDETFATNLRGPFFVTQIAAEHMKKQGRGAIVNISSVGGQFGGPKAAHYAATKGALITFTKSTARILAPDGIRVNAVAPGFIRTDMYDDMVSRTPEAEILAGIPVGRVGEPEEVGSAVVFLASDAAAYVTGETLSINGGQWMG